MADRADPPPTVPAPPSGSAALDRAAVERVLARAAELQVQATAGEGSGDTIDEAQLLEIGREVGISPAALRQAIAEERTRVTVAPESGLAARVAGPARTSATRVVAHDARTVIETLDRWLREEYDLLEKRRLEGRRTWATRTNRKARLAKQHKGNPAASAIANAREIGATVTALGDGRCAVRLDADVGAHREMALFGGGALAVAGTLTGAIPVVLGALLVPTGIAPLVMALGALPFLGFGAGGLALARAHRTHVEQAQLGLEQLLDRLEHARALPGGGGPSLPPPASLDDTIDQVARGVKQVAQAMAEVKRRAGI